MDPKELLAVVECVIFAAEKPIKASQIAEIVDKERSIVHQAVDELRKRYDSAGGGIELAGVGGGYQFRTRPEFAFWIKRSQKKRTFRLSRAALEILAIAAYRQPVTRGDLERVRGVDCDGALRTLLEKSLLRVAGKKDAPGRPLLYGTTPYFLEVFGLSGLDELPDLKQIKELFPEESGLPFHE